MGSWGSLAILPAWGAGNSSSNLDEPIYIKQKVNNKKKFQNKKIFNVVTDIGNW
jgi:hypothetical protein